MPLNLEGGSLAAFTSTELHNLQKEHLQRDSLNLLLCQSTGLSLCRLQGRFSTKKNPRKVQILLKNKDMCRTELRLCCTRILQPNLHATSKSNFGCKSNPSPKWAHSLERKRIRTRNQVPVEDWQAGCCRNCNQTSRRIHPPAKRLRHIPAAAPCPQKQKTWVSSLSAPIK